MPYGQISILASDGLVERLTAILFHATLTKLVSIL